MIRHIRRTIACILAVTIILGGAAFIAPAPTAAAAAPHFFAEALREFKSGAAGATTAALVDLDGDGVPEMVAIDVGAPPRFPLGAMRGSRLSVSRAANGGFETIDFDLYLFSVHSIFITAGNHFVIKSDFEGVDYVVYRYGNGAFVAVAIISSYYDSIAGAYEYWFNEENISGAQFNAKLNEFGIRDIAVELAGFASPRDDSAQILAMTEGATALPPPGPVMPPPRPGQFAPAPPGQVNVVFDGELMSFEVPPQIMNDRTMVPLRAIFERMGATVEWDAGTWTVTATKDDTVVTLTINDTSPTVNGEAWAIDQPGVIVNDRTLAPLRFVATAFGGEVDWDGETRTAFITTF